MSLVLSVFVLMWVLLRFSAKALEQDVVDVPTRDMTIRILAEWNANPKVAVVIFTGGIGVVKIGDSGHFVKMSEIIAVRTRSHLQRAGYLNWASSYWILDYFGDIY